MESSVIYMDKQEASKYLQDRGLSVSVKSLDRYITNGKGPKFHKFGRFVRYTLPEIDVWINEKMSPTYQSSCQVPEN
ncbi:MAG: helix-turn-helix domain-containing protein [Alphaproteobacteria bacterium]|nr:helix-turn-helix domain-containing protein [Alphaproteobacteria bacterium]